MVVLSSVEGGGGGGGVVADNRRTEVGFCCSCFSIVAILLDDISESLCVSADDGNIGVGNRCEEGRGGFGGG